MFQRLFMFPTIERFHGIEGHLNQIVVGFSAVPDNYCQALPGRFVDPALQS